MIVLRLTAIWLDRNSAPLVGFGSSGPAAALWSSKDVSSAKRSFFQLHRNVRIGIRRGIMAPSQQSSQLLPPQTRSKAHEYERGESIGVDRNWPIA